MASHTWLRLPGSHGVKTRESVTCFLRQPPGQVSVPPTPPRSALLALLEPSAALGCCSRQIVCLLRDCLGESCYLANICALISEPRHSSVALQRPPLTPAPRNEISLLKRSQPHFGGTEEVSWDWPCIPPSSRPAFLQLGEATLLVSEIRCSLSSQGDSGVS